MSCNVGPIGVTNGLIFQYDMNNTQKSWKGAPVTNLVSNPTNEVIGTTNEFVQYADLAPIFNTYGLVPYSLSLDLKATKSGDVYVYMQNGSATKYAFVAQHVSVTTSYQRFTFNNLTPSISTPTETAATLAFYGTYGTGVIPSIKNVQVELGTFATPFVNGARSNTQAILDLTKNNTITANNLTYNSDGSFSFNGSNTYASFTSPISSTGPYTIIQWLKPSTALIPGGSGASQPTGANRRTSLTGPGPIWNPGIWVTSDYLRVHSQTQYRDAAINWTTTTWNMIGMTYDGTNCQIIFNGAFLPTAYLSAYATASLSTFYIGAETSTGSSKNWLGNIDVTLMYNRVLTSAEIQQNFEAIRSRYGI